VQVSKGRRRPRVQRGRPRGPVDSTRSAGRRFNVDKYQCDPGSVSRCRVCRSPPDSCIRHFSPLQARLVGIAAQEEEMSHVEASCTSRIARSFDIRDRTVLRLDGGAAGGMAADGVDGMPAVSMVHRITRDIMVRFMATIIPDIMVPTTAAPLIRDITALRTAGMVHMVRSVIASRPWK